jgi:hypothetical protein
VRGRLRLLWGAAAAVVAAAALVAIAAILSGDFDDTDGQILATLGLVLLAGLGGLAGLSLVERGVARPLGLAVVAWAPAFFVLEAAWVWNGFEGGNFGRWAATGYVLLPVALVAATGRLILRDRRLLAVFYADCVALALATGLTLSAIWGEDVGDGGAQLTAVLWVLAVLGWAIVPLVQRALSPGRRAGVRLERVPVGEIPPDATAVLVRDGALVLVRGGAEERLGAGEAFVLQDGTVEQRRPAAGA